MKKIGETDLRHKVLILNRAGMLNEVIAMQLDVELWAVESIIKHFNINGSKLKDNGKLI